MSENDKDPRPGEYTDPTASPDWTTPSPSSGSADPTPPAPQESPTEQIPQGSTEHLPQADVPPPPSPSYDAPYQAPRGDSYPYAGSSAQPTNPYAASPPPPAGDPYAAPQPAYDPYAATGGAAAQGGYPAYQAPGQWQAPPAAYGAAPESNTSGLVLTIVSAIAMFTCCFGVFPLIFGIISLSKNATDPVGSRRMSKIGWIVFGVTAAIMLIIIVAFVAIGIAGGWDSGSSYDSDYTY